MWLDRTLLNYKYKPERVLAYNNFQYSSQEISSTWFGIQFQIHDKFLSNLKLNLREDFPVALEEIEVVRMSLILIKFK